MKRALYRALVWLHPPAFRREFGHEMLWIFDQASSSGASSLFLDGALSLLRQWLLRTRVLVVAAALAGATLQVSLGGAVLHFYRRMSLRKAAIPDHRLIANREMLFVTVWALATVVVMVAVMAFWVKTLNGRRLKSLAAGPARR